MLIQTFQIISLFVLAFYISLILFYWFYWTPKDKIISEKNNPFISVVIIGRNESKNLLNCINSILDNNYPKSSFEIIYIDDFSTDNSLELLESVEQKNFQYYELKDFVDENKINNYKKKAIETAVSKAKGEIILQTDADTFVGKNWLLAHANKYADKKINFVTGPVFITADNSSLQQFQKYDFITTMGVTCAGINSDLHYMANGANMSYRKNVFEPTDSDYASGDDMFLVQKIAEKFPGSVSFLKNKEAVVCTFPEKTIADFIRQRLRWATKTKGYKNSSMKFVVGMVFFTNLIVLANIIMIFFCGWYQVYFTVILVLSKLLIDIIFIKSISRFFNEKIEYKYLIPSLLRYPVYIVFIGVLSLIKSKYQWKSRTVK